MLLQHRFLWITAAAAFLQACGSEPVSSGAGATTSASDTSSGGSSAGGSSTGGAIGGGGAAGGGTTSTTTGSAGAVEPIALAGTYEETASSLAIGSKDVYWASLSIFDNGTVEHAIKKAPKEPGDAAVEVPDVWAYAIAIDADHMYWTDGVSIKRKPFGSVSTEVIVDNRQTVQDTSIAVDDSDVFWVEQQVGTVMKAAKDGSSVTEIANGQTSPLRVAVDDANVYWTNNADPGAVVSAPKDGGAPTVIADGEHFPLAIAVDATHVYWTTNGDQLVKKAPKGGGGPIEVIADKRFSTAITVDSQDVYWLRSDLGVERAPLGGGALTTLSVGQTGCSDIGLDDGFVYWTRNAVTNGAKVLKLPK